MRKSILIAGLVLMVSGILLAAIPVTTTHEEPVPEYKRYLVGRIETLTKTVVIGPENRIIDVAIEVGAFFKKITLRNEAGQTFTYNWVRDYKLDWTDVHIGTRYETRYQVEHPFIGIGMTSILCGIVLAIYGAVSKPIEVEYKPPTRPILCRYCRALLPEQGDYCIRCGRKIVSQ